MVAYTAFGKVMRQCRTGVHVSGITLLSRFTAGSGAFTKRATDHTTEHTSQRTTVLRLTQAGLHLLRLTGNGAASLRISVAGDINRDGAIDGLDSAAFNATPTDLDGDGQANASDRQVLYANYGWREIGRAHV